MSERVRGSVHRTVIEPAIDERLALYLLVGCASIVIGAFGGGLRITVIAVPFVIAASLGARRARPERIATRMDLSATRCLEGDRLEGVLQIAAPEQFDIEIAIVPDSDAVAPDDGSQWAWHVPAGVERPVGLPVSINAVRWGRHHLGELQVRLIAPGSFSMHEAAITSLPLVDVLPRHERGDALVTLRSARAVVGTHRARRPSREGYEFAELAPYQAGDRLRDLNWAASLRRHEPYVNRRTPELSGDLVLVLDSFPDALRRHSVVGQEAIAWAGRQAWTIANVHLVANDRVGVAIEGAHVRWMSPRTGRRARLAIFEMLVALASSSTERGDPSPARIQVPRGAQVVAITPLARRTTLDRLAAFRAGGHAVEVVAIDVGALLALGSLPSEVIRLRQLIFDERVAAMRRQGVPVRVATPTALDAA